MLVTEPLSAAQLASLGWRNRQGAADAGNQFHYFRLTDDNRVLWGGYDAVYFNGGRVSPAHDQRPATFARLAGHFFTTFPQLEDVAFEYAWGGAIDTCSRFFAFYGTARRGRLAYACRAHRPGRRGQPLRRERDAGPAVRAAHRADRSWTLVRSRPVPFPPEPARSAVVQLTRASLARADRDAGRRNLWLRTLDRFGLGFDS